MFGIGIEDLILRIVNYFINNHPFVIGVAIYILVLIAMSTLSLIIVLIAASVWIPFQIGRRIIHYFKN